MATLSRKAKDVVEGRSSEDITTLEVEAQRVLAEDAAEAVDETLRREVVSAIMQAMRVQGFATSKPVVHSTTGHVVISGTLPGGRKVRFDVALDGAMHFDMDGFADWSCADHLDQVLERMEQEFSVATGRSNIRGRIRTEFRKAVEACPVAAQDGRWVVALDGTTRMAENGVERGRISPMHHLVRQRQGRVV